MWFRKKKQLEIPWYKRGYIQFPDVESVAFIMKGHDEDVIFRISNNPPTVIVETNAGTFLNKQRAKLVWDK